MPLPGGESQKVGDRYENWAVVYHMKDVLTGKASAICPQALGTAVDDFVLTLDNGTERYFQAKRQRSSGHWSLAALDSEGILNAFAKQLQQNPGSECCFISGVSATELAELTKRARDSSDFKQFQSTFLSVNSQNERFKEFTKRIKQTPQDAYRCLKKIYIVTIDEVSLKKGVLDWCSHYFPKHSESIADILYCFATERLHQQITGDSILEHLESRGFAIGGHLKSLSKQPTEPQVVFEVPQQTQSNIAVSLSRIERKIDHLVPSATVELTADGVGEKAAQVALAKRLLESRHFRSAKVVLDELRCQMESSPGIALDEVKAKVYNNLGVCAQQRGASREAAVLYRKAYSLQPDNPKYRANLAIAHSLEKRPQEALAIADVLLREVPRDVHAIVVRSQIFHDLGRTDEAIEFLKSKVRGIPNNANLCGLLGYIQLQTGLYDDAIASARRARGLDRDDYDHTILLANALLMRVNQHLRVLQPLPWQMPESDLKDLQEADRLYGTALDTMLKDEVPQQYAWCLTNRAATRMALGRFDHALSDVQMALEINPDQPVARLNRAILRRDQANSAEIEADFKIALSHSEEPTQVLVPYSLFLLDGNRPQECLKLLDSHQEQVKLNPHLGLLRAKTEDQTKGGHVAELEFLRKTVEENPKDIGARSDVAALLGEMGKDDEAEQEFDRALHDASEQERVEVELTYARYLGSVKKYKRALPLYKKNVPVDRDSPFLDQYITCLLNLKEYAECLGLLQGLPKTVRQERRIADILAQLEEYFENCKTAADIWQMLRKKNPDEARYSVHLALCLFRIGKHENAKKVVQDTLPTMKKASPDDRMRIAHLLASMGLVDEGIRQGYLAATAVPEDPQLSMAYVSLVLFSEREEQSGLDVAAVVHGCVVDVIMGNQKICWYFPTKKDPLPSPPNCSMTRDAKVYAALQGKKVGDSFSYQSAPAGGSVQGMIEQIRSPQVKLLHEILETIEYLAPDLQAFRKIDVSKGFDEVTDLVVDQGRHHAHIHRLYEKEGLPICCFAKLLGKDQAELFIALLESPGMKLDMLPGTEPERDAENNLMRRCNHAVIDLPTLVLLGYLDRLEFLGLFSKPVVVTQSIMDGLQQKMLLDYRIKDGYHVLGAVGDFVRMDEVSADVVQRRITVFKRIRTFLADSSKCELRGRSPHPRISKAIEKYFGEEMLDTLNLSLDLQIPLLLGDRRLLAFARPPKVISLRAVVAAALERNFLDERKYVSMMAAIARLGVWFVSIDAKILGIAFNGWISGDDPKDLIDLLDTIADESTNLEGAAKVVGHFVADLFVAGISDFYVTNATIMALAALCRKRGTGTPLSMFRSYVKPRLRLAPHKMKQLDRQIEIWQRLNPIRLD